MNISIGNDHAGTDYKFAIVEFLKSKNITVDNYGTDTNNSVDYPDYVHPVAQDIVLKKSSFSDFEIGAKFKILDEDNNKTKIDGISPVIKKVFLFTHLFSFSNELLLSHF